MLTANTAEIPSEVISFELVAPYPMPAFWMMASNVPVLFASSASFFVSLIEDRSPMRTPSAPGRASLACFALCAFLAWRVTWWPLSQRALAAARPIPSLDPVMKTRTILMLLRFVEIVVS